MLQDAETFVRAQNIYNPENFHKDLKKSAEFAKKHYNEYKALPTLEQINAITSSNLNKIDGLAQEHLDWCLDSFEEFTRKQELERAIIKSADLLEKGEFSPVEKLIKDALHISLTKDLGLDYFEDPKGRNLRLKSGNGQVSTGWPTLDRLLYGGFSRGELNIFAGGSGSGKSLVMMNLSVNWAITGLNGVYLSLELYEDMSAKRIDSMKAGVPSKDIFRDLDTVEMKVKMMQKKSGDFRIKYMPAQSTVNDIRSYLKELQVKTGKRVDFLCVDYLDLLMPVSAKVSPNDLFVKDKYVSEELRNLAKELGVIFVTASQLNRAAVDEIEFDHSHISGGISKINTADNVFGIFTSRAMRERGKYQVQLMKTRSSGGVGQKVELDFNIETLRITDPDEGEDSGKPRANIYDTIKKNIKTEENSDSVYENTPVIKADVQSKKLSELLGKIKAGG